MSSRNGKLRGIGVGMYIEALRRRAGRYGDAIKIDSRAVILFSGIQDNGQGHTTTFVQILSNKPGVDEEKIRIVQGDTDIVPPEALTGARVSSRSAALPATYAADEVIEIGSQKARRLEAAASGHRVPDGEFRSVGTDR